MQTTTTKTTPNPRQPQHKAVAAPIKTNQRKHHKEVLALGEETFFVNFEETVEYNLKRMYFEYNFILISFCFFLFFCSNKSIQKQSTFNIGFKKFYSDFNNKVCVCIVMMRVGV